MFAPALIGPTQPSAQTILPSPAQPWPRERLCVKMNSEIAVCCAWDLPPLHAVRNEIAPKGRAHSDAGEKEARGVCFLARTRQEWVGENKPLELPSPDTA